MGKGKKKQTASYKKADCDDKIDDGSITAEKQLWAFEKDEKTGNVTIVPMNGEQIVIHGKTEAEMFCSILTQCFQ